MLKKKKFISLALTLFFALGLILPSINVGQAEAVEEIPQVSKVTYQKFRDIANVFFEKIAEMDKEKRDDAILFLELQLLREDEDQDGLDDGIEWLSDKIFNLSPDNPPLGLSPDRVNDIINKLNSKGLDLEEAASAIKLLSFYSKEDRQILLNKLKKGGQDLDDLFEPIKDTEFIKKLKEDFKGIEDIELPEGYSQIEELSFIGFVAKYTAGGPIFTDDGDSIILMNDNEKLNQAINVMDKYLDGIDTIYGKYDKGDAWKVLGLFEEYIQKAIDKGYGDELKLVLETYGLSKPAPETPGPGPGPGGGGGGSIPVTEGTITVSADAKKAAFLDNNVVLDILSGTFTESTKITVKKVKEADITLPVQKVNAKYMLAGEVVELDAEGKTFNKPITVTFKYDKEKLSEITDQDLKKLGVYRYNETNKQWEYVGGKVDTVNGTVTVMLDSFSKYAVLYYDRTFNDIVGHWAQKDIELMAARHIAAGMTDNQFVPDANITRAQFASLLGRVLGLKEVSVTTSQFADVEPNAWYAGSIQAAYEAGLIAGISAT
ncbi:MAG: S-layer homology domain-containing protein, partial [Peptococcales bacterium]